MLGAIQTCGRRQRRVSSDRTTFSLSVRRQQSEKTAHSSEFSSDPGLITSKMPQATSDWQTQDLAPARRTEPAAWQATLVSMSIQWEKKFTTYMMPRTTASSTVKKTHFPVLCC